ncbi:MAG: SDR family oxidoreductase, partial [Gemmatimonadales bacterium]|nr:SDR family oxidoreductase [Gemmatimonadales bacterium]
VPGAGAGGAAAAEALGVAGAVVVRVARSLAPVQTDTRLDVPCDLTDARAVEELVGRVTSSVGVPRIVVSNAGAFAIASLQDTAPEEFRCQLEANLVAPFLVARSFVPLMREAGGGRLITIGSIADHVGFPDNVAYAASKYGLRGLHEVLRAELAGSGVRCSLVSPGPTDTSAWDVVDPDARPGFTPRAKMLRAEDVAEAVRWIATLPGHVDVDWLRLGPAS